MVAQAIDRLRTRGGHPRDLLDTAWRLTELLIDADDPRGGELVAAFAVDPGRIEAFCHGQHIGGDTLARMRRWSGVETITETEDRKARERRHRREIAAEHDQRQPACNRQREIRRRLRECPDSRHRMAVALRAKIQGRQAVGITCPECDRRAVWFWIEPGRMSGARCKHLNSCGWWGSLELLAGGVER